MCQIIDKRFSILWFMELNSILVSNDNYLLDDHWLCQVVHCGKNARLESDLMQNHLSNFLRLPLAGRRLLSSWICIIKMKPERFLNHNCPNEIKKYQYIIPFCTGHWTLSTLDTFNQVHSYSHDYRPFA